MKAIWLAAVLVLAAWPASAQWYYCDASHAYYPYVDSCSMPWRPVEAVPLTGAIEQRSEKAQPSITAGELQVVRHQIEACWSPPDARAHSDGPTPEFRVTMNSDGTVQSTTLINPTASADPYFTAASKSADAALQDSRCQPLKLPKDKFQQWKTFTITFDPFKSSKPASVPSQRPKDVDAGKAAQAPASPALLAYEAKVHPLFEMVGEAQEAQLCTLRSIAWATTIEEGAVFAMQGDPENLKLSDAEQVAMTNYSLGVMVATARQADKNYLAVCRGLLNSREMDRLDALESKMTGGYR